MFFVGFFSHIISIFLLGLGSISMLYYGNQEKIDAKLNHILTGNSETFENKLNRNDSYLIQFSDQITETYIANAESNIDKQIVNYCYCKLIAPSLIEKPNSGYFEFNHHRGPPVS